MRLSFKSRNGFTLVELLIVVAIIGVLSTIGVPTYRRMIQKAKMTEARVNLGAIFKAESIFAAEWNTYTNNLRPLYEPDNLINEYEYQGTYTVGFPAWQCVHPSHGPVPDEASVFGAKLNSAMPSFYKQPPVEMYRPQGTALTAPCLVGNVAANGTAFTATASGIVSPSVDPATTNLEEIDQWSVNEKRELSHVHDGSK